MIQTAQATAHVFPLAAVCLPVFANIPRTPLVAEEPHPGLQALRTTSRPGPTLAISNTATGFQVCLYDSGIRPCCSAKERDAETGLDYFGARYFSSAQGRFTTPDWSAVPQPVPYADLIDPQSLNLYTYVRNNPLKTVDPDGHCGLDLNCWSQFGSGFADASYRPVVQAVSHPINTLSAVGNAALHPLNTAVAIKNSVVETANATLSGDPNAVGKVAGTVASALVTAGVGKAATSLVQGARAAITEGVALTAEQAKNLARFSKALPSAATGTSVDSLGDGVLFTAEVPGRVPGSQAVYQKAVDASGKTTSYVKTTFDPKGNVVHIKDKMLPPQE